MTFGKHIPPHLIKSGLVLLLVILSVVILYYGQTFLKTLVLAAILAMLFEPLQRQMVNSGVPEKLGIIICVLLFLLFFFVIAFLLYWQISLIMNDFSILEKNAEQVYTSFQDWISANLGINKPKITDSFSNWLDSMKSEWQRYFSLTLSTLFQWFLLIVYLITILYYRFRFTKFVLKYTKEENKPLARLTMTKVKNVSYNYFKGRLFLMAILGVFYYVGLTLVGVKYALLIAVIGSLLSMIPYIGVWVGFFIAAALSIVSSGSPVELIWVTAVYFGAQVIESYLLEPWIMSGELSINAFVVIAAVVGFGILWGIIGAFLALPLIAILQVVFEEISGLKPIGYVLSESGEDED